MQSTTNRATAITLARSGYSFSSGHRGDQASANEEYKTTQEVAGEQRQPSEESSSVDDQQHAWQPQE